MAFPASFLTRGGELKFFSDRKTGLRFENFRKFFCSDHVKTILASAEARAKKSLTFPVRVFFFTISETPYLQYSSFISKLHFEKKSFPDQLFRTRRKIFFAKMLTSLRFEKLFWKTAFYGFTSDFSSILPPLQRLRKHILELVEICVKQSARETVRLILYECLLLVFHLLVEISLRLLRMSPHFGQLFPIVLYCLL